MSQRRVLLVGAVAAFIAGILFGMLTTPPVVDAAAHAGSVAP